MIHFQTLEAKRSLSVSHCLTIRAVDAGMLVVTEEENVCALTLVAAHGVDTHLLAAAVIVQTLVYICQDEKTQRDKVSRGSMVE